MGTVTINFGVNYLVIVIAAIAAVVIGALYYGLLGFGDRQSRMLGATPARPGPMQLATGLVVGLVNAWVIALLSLNLGPRRSATGSFSARSCGWGSARHSRPRR